MSDKFFKRDNKIRSLVREFGMEATLEGFILFVKPFDHEKWGQKLLKDLTKTLENYKKRHDV